MPITRSEALDSVTPYQLFMLAISLAVLLALGAATFGGVSDSTRTILNYADTAVCALFFVDFLGNLWRAPRKLHYLATWGWIDLLSSIPVVDALRWGRAARVLRMLRVLRLVRSARAIAQFVLLRRAQSGLLAATLLALLLLVSCSIAILQFELPAGGNITSAQDAMWWAITTMTTVGYGDRFPITPEGRLIAVALMVAGVGVFGTFSGLVASWFLSPGSREARGELHDVQEELRAIRGMIEKGTNRMT